MSGFTGISFGLYDDTRATPEQQAGLNGISVLLRDELGTPSFQAGITGLAFGVVLRTVVLRLFKLVGNGYVPLVGLSATIDLLDSVDSQTLISNASGVVSFEFSDVNIALTVEAVAGHQAQLTHSLRAGFRNEIVLTYLPDSLTRLYPLAQVL